MTKRVSVREARAHFADLIGSVQHTGEPVVIERRGKPVVALVKPEQVVAAGTPAPADDDTAAKLEAILADAPVLRTVIEAGRRYRPARALTSQEIEEVVAQERVEAFLRKLRRGSGR